MTLRRFLSRDRTPVRRITVTPVAGRVVDVPDMAAALVMPPRPQLRRPDSSLPPVTGGQPMHVYGNRDSAEDPCGRPPLARSRKRRP